MKTRCLPLVAALLLAASALPASAQSSAPADSASAPVKAGPRLLTPLEMRDNATAPGDIRPEHPVTPQIRIPFGKKPPASSKPEPTATRPGNAASAGSHEDAVAQCEAQRGEQVRAKCRDELARQARIRQAG
jgi:hypothetical protein